MPQFTLARTFQRLEAAPARAGERRVCPHRESRATMGEKVVLIPEPYLTF